MIELKNRELRIELLDPEADAARLGARYCWGGYVWQVHDAAGPLLVGPEWPHPEPTAFNGQGLPESFRHRTLEGLPLTWRGEVGVALGAGELRQTPESEVRLTEPCTWQLARREDRLTFTTQHAAAGFAYGLSRTIALTGRDVHSVTELVNRSTSERLVLQWFAHPFFPLVDGTVRARVPQGTTLAENPGFRLDGRVLEQKRRFQHRDDGHMDRSFRLLVGRKLDVTLAHPSATSVAFATDFIPDWCVIWGNDRTFSFEPYLVLDLAPGESRRWSLRYRFGASSGISVSKETSRAPELR